MARENFYLILELPFDPPEEDFAVIKQAIERKRLEWSKGSTDFKKGPIYRAYLSMLPEIKEVMGDNEKRRAEYEQAYRVTYDRVRHMLAIIEKRGFLYESEVESIAKRLQVEEGMVRKACNVRIVEGTPNNGAIIKPAGADRFHVLQVYLDTVNKKDYYDFINYYGTMHKRLKDMPTYRLLELVQNLKIMYPKNTPEESAIEKLCAECEKTFATKESKQEYDEYLMWKNTEEIFEQVQVASELTKVLDESQFEEAVKLLTEVVDEKERSYNLLEDYCRQNGIALDFIRKNREEQASSKQQRVTKEQKKLEEETEYKVQPNMPINLKIQVDTVKRCNHITWEKTTMDSNVNYLIVRKRGMPPRHINDGELLGTVSSSSYTDATIFPGKLYYYGVFAVKRGVYSKGICTQVGYLNLFEVQDASISIKDGAAYLSWVQNYRECRVVIFRQEGNAPMDYGEGKLVYSAGHMSFKDSDIKDGSTYYYRIFTTIYVNGRRYHSKGVIISATIKKEKKAERTYPIVTKKAATVPEPKEYQPLKSVRPAWPDKRTEQNRCAVPKSPVAKEGDRQQKQAAEEYPVLHPVERKRPERKAEESPGTEDASDLFKESAPTPEKQATLPKRKPGPYMKPHKKAAAKNSLLYQVKVRKGIFKPKGIEIVVEAGEDTFELPPLLIVASKGYPPAYKEAGSLIGTIEKQTVVKSCSHAIALPLLGDNDYIKLFLANEADEDQYEIHLKYGASSKFTK